MLYEEDVGFPDMFVMSQTIHAVAFSGMVDYTQLFPPIFPPTLSSECGTVSSQPISGALRIPLHKSECKEQIEMI